MSSAFDPYSAYPPSPTSRTGNTMRINTRQATTPSIRSSTNTMNTTHTTSSPSRSKFQPPLYDLPVTVNSDAPNAQAYQSRARPGGLAGIPSSSTPTAIGSGVGNTSRSMTPSNAVEERYGGRVRSPPGTPGGLRALQYRQQQQQQASSSSAASTHAIVLNGNNFNQRPGRRLSNEPNIVAPSLVTRSSFDHNQPMPNRRDGSRNRASPVPGRVKSPPTASVYSGRDGVGFGRVEGVGSPSPAELQLFAHHCRLFYFSPNPPPDSATFISTTLASLPPSHRASYTRLQSSLRSLAHLHHLRVRVSSFHALISSTIASASLTPIARNDLTSKRAIEERRDRFARYLGTWCTSSAGGVEPFFRGLWAAMKVQSRGDENKGGAGGRRVVWEIDDAVFLESGGAEFMHETVMILKGVLGFTDQPLTSPPKLRRIRTIPRSYLDTKLRAPGKYTRSGSNSPRPPLSQRSGLGNNRQNSEEQELLATESGFTKSAPPPPLPQRRTNSSTNSAQAQPRSQSKGDALRSRAISDPFIDPSVSLSGSPQKRTPSGRGPAPPPPPSRQFHSPSPQRVASGSIPNPLQIDPISSISEPMTPGYPSAESPLLPQTVIDPSGIVSALEAAAAAASEAPALSEDQEHLLSRRTMSGSTQNSGSGLYHGGVVSASGSGLNGMAVTDIEEEALRFDEDEDDDDKDDPTEDDIHAEETELNKPRFRLWTFPSHLTDQEISSLLSLFPAFISKSRKPSSSSPSSSSKKITSDPRFPFVRPGRGLKDLEANTGGSGDGGGGSGSDRWDRIIVDEGKEVKVPKLEAEDEEGVLRYGTGRMWVGLEGRRAGWAGGTWFRFVRWWKRLFGAA